MWLLPKVFDDSVLDPNPGEPWWLSASRRRTVFWTVDVFSLLRPSDSQESIIQLEDFAIEAANVMHQSKKLA